MELVQELLVTAVLAVLFSYIVAKLVTVAMAGDASAESQAKLGDGVGIDQGSAVEEVKFEDRLSARGFELESRVEFVENDVEQVHLIEAEPVPLQDVEVERTVSEMIEVDSHEVAEKSLDAVESIEKPLEEEKSGQCCVEEVKRGDEESIENYSVESAPDQARVAESEELNHLKCETEKVEEEISRRDRDDEDDDWVGIERTELEKDFALAVKFVGPGDTNHRLESVGSDVKMQLYGLHKVATEGPCHEPHPMALMVSARSKWNAWQRLGNMSPEVAMEHYIALLSENVPGWREEKCADATKLDVGSSCNDSSTICNELLEFGDGRNTATNSNHDVAESVDKNSENKAKD